MAAQGNVALALVFIHGFISGPEAWEKMQGLIRIDDEIKHLTTMHLYPYTTKIARVNPLKRLPSIDDIARGLNDYIDLMVPERRVLLVTHSQGGLVAQRYIANELVRPASQTLSRIVGLLMYATPSGGSDLLLSLRRPLFRMLGGNPQESELRPLNDRVHATQRQIFESIILNPSPRYQLRILATVGQDDNVVQDVSGRSMFPDTRTLPGDHNSVIRPEVLNDLRYLALKHEVLAALGKADQPWQQTPSPGNDNGNDEANTTIFSLPSVPKDFIGRGSQLAEVEKSSSDGSPLIANIYGRAGVGKTTLAVEFARSAQNRFRRLIYINMRGYEVQSLRAYDVIGDILRAYGMAPSKLARNLEMRSGQLRTMLRSTPTLLVIDNCESEDQIRPMLPADSSTGVLTTSRRPIIIEGMQTIWLRELEMADAKQLIYKNRKYDQSDEKLVEDLCESCGLLPLALRIVAAALRQRPESTLSEIGAALSDSRRRLSELRIGDFDLEASLSLNLPSLNALDRSMFRLLATLPLAEVHSWHVASGQLLTLDISRGLLQRLADQQFIEFTGLLGSTGERRYRYHDLLRDLGQKYANVEDSWAVRIRFLGNVADAYVVLAEVAGLAIGLDGAQIEGTLGATAWNGVVAAADVIKMNPVAWMDEEARNIILLIEQLFKDGLHRQTWLLARAVSTYLDSACNWDAWIRVCSLGIDAAIQESDIEAQATMSLHLGVAYSRIGRTKDAEEELSKASTRFASINDGVGNAWALFRQGEVFRLDDSYERATELYHDTFACLTDAHLRTAVASYAHLGLGSVYRVSGDISNAVRELSEGVARAVGDEYPRAVGWISFAHSQALSDDGQYSQAEIALARARESFQLFPAKIGQTWTTLQALDLRIRTRRHDARRDLLEVRDLVQMFNSIGDTRGEGWGHYAAAQLWILQERYVEAASNLESSQRLFAACRSRMGQIHVALQRATLPTTRDAARLLSDAHTELETLKCSWSDELVDRKVVGWLGW